VKVLSKVDEGLSIAVFRHQYGANKSAVFSFKKNEDQIRGNSKSNVPLSTNISYLSCDPFLGKIERALCIWLEVLPCVSL
jgi:hypothetical protein